MLGVMGNFIVEEEPAVTVEEETIAEPIAELGFVEEIEGQLLELGGTSEWTLPDIESQDYSYGVIMIPDPLLAPYLTYQPQTSIVYFNGELADESMVGLYYKIDYKVIFSNDIETTRT